MFKVQVGGNRWKQHYLPDCLPCLIQSKQGASLHLLIVEVKDNANCGGSVNVFLSHCPRQCYTFIWEYMDNSSWFSLTQFVGPWENIWNFYKHKISDMLTVPLNAVFVLTVYHIPYIISLSCKIIVMLLCQIVEEYDWLGLRSEKCLSILWNSNAVV